MKKSNIPCSPTPKKYHLFFFEKQTRKSQKYNMNISVYMFFFPTFQEVRNLKKCAKFSKFENANKKI